MNKTIGGLESSVSAIPDPVPADPTVEALTGSIKILNDAVVARNVEVEGLRRELDSAREKLSGARREADFATKAILLERHQWKGAQKRAIRRAVRERSDVLMGRFRDRLSKARDKFSRLKKHSDWRVLKSSVDARRKFPDELPGDASSSADLAFSTEKDRLALEDRGTDAVTVSDLSSGDCNLASDERDESEDDLVDISSLPTSLKD